MSVQPIGVHAPHACPQCGRPDDSAGTRFYTPDDLAERWGEPVHRVRRWIRQGHIQDVKLGTYHKVSGREVDRFERGEMPALMTA